MIEQHESEAPFDNIATLELYLEGTQPPCLVVAQFHYTQGTLRRITIPGSEVLSPEPFGLTGSFTVVADTEMRGNREFARLKLLTFQNGTLVKSESRQPIEVTAESRPRLRRNKGSS